jgi:hypothetical protein
MRPGAWVLAISMLALPACLPAPPPAQRVSEVAREVNEAARFGRMELALEHTAAGTQRHFTKRRSEWGKAVRVLDFELSGLSMHDAENATVMVDIQWMRVDEDSLRLTRVEQTWRGAIEDRGWTLVRERRVGGDLGLFGEPVARAAPGPAHGDVQFAAKTIR